MQDTLAKSRVSGTLQKVMAYQNLDLVHRLKEKLELTEVEAVLLFEDLKRFLFLCSDKEMIQSPPPKIDAAWHEFLMFTKDYAGFCQDHFGYFIHHNPRRIGDKPTNGARTKKTVQLAFISFGPELSANWDQLVVEDALASDPCDSCGCNAAL